MQNIILLEDQVVVRNVMVETASELSDRIHITCADSVKAARQLFEDQPWDGMVADLTLGDGESLELISELRERDIDIPIILASGFLSPEKLEEADKLGIEHILHKPFHPAALLDCLEKAFLSSGAVPDSAAPETTTQEEITEATHLMHGHLLPELFAMDRHLGLLFRLLNDVPKHKEVSKICSSSLTLAMDIVRAHSGFLALYERDRKKLVLATHNGLEAEDMPGELAVNCGLENTPFESLMEGREDYIQSAVEPGQSYNCWPGMSAHCYIAIPIRLEQRAMGVICLMDYREASLNEQAKELQPEFDCLLLQVAQPVDSDVPIGKDDSENVELRQATPESKKTRAKKKQMRQVGDIMRRVNSFVFLTCLCGLKMKIPPNFKANKIACPRCGKISQIPKPR